MLEILLDEEMEGLKITPELVQRIIDEALDHYAKTVEKMTKTETSLVLLLKALKNARMKIA